MSELTLATCSACAGTGSTASASGSLACSACGGFGSWLETAEGRRLTLPMPAFIRVEAAGLDAYRRNARYAALGLSAAGTAIGGYASLVAYPGFPGSLLWQRGVTQALFGLSGLGLCWSAYGLSAMAAPAKRLEELDADLAATNGPFDLGPYCHPRFAAFLAAAARDGHALNQAAVSDTVALHTLLMQPRLGGLLGRLEVSASLLADELAGTLAKEEPRAADALALEPAVREAAYRGFLIARSGGYGHFDLEHLFASYLGPASRYATYFKAAGIAPGAFEGVSRWYDADATRRDLWSQVAAKGRTRRKGYMNKAWTALPTPYLDAYGEDLTRRAAAGGSPSVSARAAELQRMLEVLGRAKKNNLLLIGEPGVGKQSLLEGLAGRMILGKVPDTLRDKRLVSMDLAALVGDGSAPEGNIQRVLDEVVRAGNVILAIPDVKALVGTAGSLDAASLLSNALNKGYVQVIATAGYPEYHRYVEANAGLSAAFETIEVKEPTVEQAVTILEEEAPLLESRHGVALTYPALQAAAALAKEYLADRVLPDSAVSLIDEAASAAAQAGKRWVFKEDVEATVEKKTNVPVRQASEEEAGRLLHLEENLHKRVIGQDQAVGAVAGAIRRSRAGLRDKRRPISSFLFVGPTGVGKTETAQALAALYYGSEEAMLRLDMSEYQDAASVYRLIGRPDAADGGTLTRQIREHPYSLVLLDELEKAYPDVLNLFLQLLEDGRLTESGGRTVSFTNAIVIATSNAGSAELAELLTQGLAADDLAARTLGLLSRRFKPEFLNRFDAIVPFRQLNREEVSQVVGLMLDTLRSRVIEQGYALEVDPDAVTAIAKLGYDATYGARPLRRFIQDRVEARLADLILRERPEPGTTLRITAAMVE